MTDRIDTDEDSKDRIDGVLKNVAELSEDGDKVAFGDLIEALGSRGFGPLLLIMAGALMLPIATVPGLPAIIGLVVVALGVQMLRGKKGIWLPGFVRRFKLGADRLGASADKAAPYADKLRSVLSHRLTWATSGSAVLTVIALIVLVSGVAIIVVGFVPFLPFLIAIHLMLFGIGLTADDGVFVIAGFVWLAPLVYFATRLI